MEYDYTDLKNIKKDLEKEYQERHDDHAKLRKFYKDEYWDMDSKEGISSLFQDLRHSKNFMDDIKLVHNVLHSVCVKYQTYLSPTPMIHFFADAPNDAEQRHIATLKERYVYGVWNAGNM